MSEGVSKKFSIFILLFLAALLGLVLIYSDRGLIRLYELRDDKQKIETANDELRETNRRLMARVERIKTDRLYIEDEARKKLGLIRPDETIYRLREEPERVPGEVSGGESSGATP
jgi:cell division protein FtsB